MTTTPNRRRISNRFRGRVVAPFRQSGCAGLGGHLACIPGPTVPHDRCEIMGPHQIQPRAFYELVAASQLGSDWTADKRAAIVDYMATWGECLWHTVAVVLGRAGRCACAACKPGDLRHPWRLLDLELALTELLDARAVKS